MISEPMENYQISYINTFRGIGSSLKPSDKELYKFSQKVTIEMLENICLNQISMEGAAEKMET